MSAGWFHKNEKCTVTGRLMHSSRSGRRQPQPVGCDGPACMRRVAPSTGSFVADAITVIAELFAHCGLHQNRGKHANAFRLTTSGVAQVYACAEGKENAWPCGWTVQSCCSAGGGMWCSAGGKARAKTARHWLPAAQLPRHGWHSGRIIWAGTSVAGGSSAASPNTQACQSGYLAARALSITSCLLP